MQIYKIVNLVNGKLYIGQTTKSLQHRFKRHIYLAKRGKNAPLYDAMRKYGIDNFRIELIVAASSRAELDYLEIRLINELKTIVGQNGYNIAPGGEGGDVFTNNPRKEELRQDAVRRGVPAGLAAGRDAYWTRYKLGQVPRRIYSSEARKRKSLAAIAAGVKPPPYSRSGAEHHLYGKPVSDETRHKMSIAAARRVVSAATREKHRSFWATPENVPTYKAVDMSEVSRMLGQGLSGPKIAGALGISRQTLYAKVKRHYGMKIAELKAILLSRARENQVLENHEQTEQSPATQPL